MNQMVRLFFFIAVFSIVSTLRGQEILREKLPATKTTTLQGHQSIILSTAMAPDGRTAATGASDRTAILWDTLTGKEKLKIRAAGSGITALTFNGDGTILATGSREKDVVFWNTTTGEELKRFPNHTATVTSLTIHTEGKFLVFGLDNGQAGVWDIETVKPLHPLNEHSRSITASTTAEKRPITAFASQDRTASVWNLVSGKQQAVFKEHQASVESIALDAVGNRVVTGSADRSAMIWNAANGKLLQKLEGHSAPVTFVAFAPDGATVYTASADKTFIQWNAATGKPIIRCTVDFPVVRAAISADAYYTVATGSDQTAFVFRTDALRFTEPRQGPPTGKGPFGRLLVKEKPVLRLNPLQKPAPPKVTLSQKTPQDPLPSKPQNNLAVFHPVKPWAVTAGSDDNGALWNLEDGETLFRFNCSTAFTALAVHPQNGTIAAGARDGNLFFYQATTGERIRSIRGHSRSINAIAYSKDGTRLLTVGIDRNLVLWDVASGKLDCVLQGHKGAVNGIAFLSDQNRAVSVSEDKTVRLWKLDDKSSTVSDEQASPLISLALSPDGSWFAVGEAGGGEAKTAISVWNAETLKPTAKVDTLISAPQTLDVSPDGNILASGGVDGTAVLWDVKTWKAFRVYPQIPRETVEKMETEAADRAAKKQWFRFDLDRVVFEPVRSVAFNKDGTRLMSSGGRDTLFWDVSKVVPPSILAERQQASIKESPAQAVAAAIPVARPVRMFEEFPAPILDIAPTRDASKLSAALSSKAVLLLNGDNGKEISRLTARSPFMATVFLPDGRTLLAGGEDGRFFSVNTISRKDNFSEKGHTAPVTCIAVTPTGSKAVTGGEDRIAVIWDPKKGENLGRLSREHKGTINDVAINRDGSRILTASEDRKAILWDAKMLTPLETLEDHRQPVQAVAFSPDGNRFVTASTDRTAIVYQTATGKEQIRLQGTEPFTCIEFSPDGNYLLTGDEAAHAILWNAADGKPVRRFPARFKPLLRARFIGGGKQAIVVDGKTILFYETGIE